MPTPLKEIIKEFSKGGDANVTVDMLGFDLQEIYDAGRFVEFNAKLVEQNLAEKNITIGMAAFLAGTLAGALATRERIAEEE